MVVLVLPGFSRDLDSSADAVAVSPDPDGLNQNPMVLRWRGVVEDLWRSPNYGNYNVDLAVIFEVAKRSAPMSRANSQIGASLIADILEAAVMQVTEYSI